MALGKEHQGAKNEEGNVLAAVTLIICQEVNIIWKIHRPHNERQNVTAKNNTALTLRDQLWGTRKTS